MLLQALYVIFFCWDISWPAPPPMIAPSRQIFKGYVRGAGKTVLLFFFLLQRTDPRTIQKKIEAAQFKKYLVFGKIKEYHTFVNVGNDNDQKDPLKNYKYNYTKITLRDPYNNRDILAKFERLLRASQPIKKRCICLGNISR